MDRLAVNRWPSLREIRSVREFSGAQIVFGLQIEP
jgi:hypothetical protein